MISQVNRRHFIRVAGATMFLPTFTSLLSAAERKVAYASTDKKLLMMYLPNGMVRRCFFPGEEGDDIPVALGGFEANKLLKAARRKNPYGVFPFPMTQTLRPLAKIAEDVTLLTGLDRSFKSGQDVHAQGASCYLTSVSPNQANEKGWKYPNGRSLDQVIGDAVGKSSVYRTLEVSCNGYRSPLEDIYFDNISWYGPGKVAPSIKSPRKLYKRLFMSKQLRGHVENVTDLVLEDTRSLKRMLGREDQQVLDEFMTNVRDLELRVTRAEGLAQGASIEAPGTELLPRGEYIRVMADLVIAALQMGLTHVATMMIGPERWGAPLLYEGVFDDPQNHHSLSHNQFGDGYKKLQKIDEFHMAQFAYVVQRMASVGMPNGSSLLDNAIITCGAGLGDGATHQFFDLPMLVAGRAQGQIVQGRWLAAENGTPHSNLWLTIAQLMGLDMDSFADSRGVLSDLWA